MDYLFNVKYRKKIIVKLLLLILVYMIHNRNKYFLKIGFAVNPIRF